MIRKTAAITAASIAGVIIAGGAAVGANIGILNAADDNSLGQLSAELPIAAAESETSAISIAGDPSPSASFQSFDVDVAGTVELETDGDLLVVAGVRTNEGWAWVNTTTDPGTVTITFMSDTDRLEFAAAVNADGTITAAVDRPIPALGGQPSMSSSSSASYEDDGHDDDEYDEYDNEYEDHDDEEYEGRDDDD